MNNAQIEISDIIQTLFIHVGDLFEKEFLGVELSTYVLSMLFISLVLSFLSYRMKRKG